MAATRHKLLSYLTRVVVCIGALALAIGITAALIHTAPQPVVSDAPPDAPRIVVVQMTPVPVQRVWDVLGTIEASHSADVPSRVTATVLEVPAGIEEGRSVNRGDVLVQLDDSDFARQVDVNTQLIVDLEAQLQRIDVEQTAWSERERLATESVGIAQAEYDRVKAAFASDAAKQMEVDQRRAGLLAAQRELVAAQEELAKIEPRRSSLRSQKAGAEASLRLARENVARSRITSPIDGILQAVDVDEGESLSAGQRVARVVNPDHVEAVLKLPASARSDVRHGDVVNITAGSSGRQWSAQISRIAPEDDAATRTMTAYVNLERSAGHVVPPAPGSFVRGTVTSSSIERRCIVPRRSIRADRLMVVRKGVVHSLPAHAAYPIEGTFPVFGVPDTDWVVLRDDPVAGELVVLNGSAALGDGSSVTPIIAGEPDDRARIETARASGDNEASTPSGTSSQPQEPPR